MTTRATDSLRPHPLNATIYNAQPDDSDLRRSVSERGILAPLIIDQHSTILSGHRRWHVALALALATVPVVVREVADELEGQRLLIESNRQREKTYTERMNEAAHLERIAAAENRAKMLAGVTVGGAGGRGRRKNPRATLHEGSRPGRTDAATAESVGLKQRTYTKVRDIHTRAHDDAAPEPVKAVAQQQMAQLDAGETTPNAAHRALREAETREKVSALPDQEPTPDPFADRPLVRAARLVKNARKALKATADYLQTYAPEELAEAVELTGAPDIVTDDLAAVARWIADYQRALKRRRSSLHVVS